MKKLKLNIQRFSSTNHTQYYDLSQYTANDKPTYLVDYNGDMLKIDTALYTANQKALENETAIGTLSNLNTTAKNNLVSAINEVNTQVGTNTGDISTISSNVTTNTNNIGTLADLSTTNKSNLVNAINEVKSVNDTQNTNIAKNSLDITNLINAFNLSNISQITNFIFNQGSVASNSQLYIAINNDNSIFKLYGELRITPNIAGNIEISFDTPLRPDQDYFITGIGYGFQYQGNYQAMLTAKVETSGRVTLYWYNLTANVQDRLYLPPCLYFNKDFGDTSSN